MRPQTRTQHFVERPRAERRGCARSVAAINQHDIRPRSEEHTSELQSLMRISYAVFCLKKKKKKHKNTKYSPITKHKTHNTLQNNHPIYKQALNTQHRQQQ